MPYRHHQIFFLTLRFRLALGRLKAFNAFSREKTLSTLVRKWRWNLGDHLNKLAFSVGTNIDPEICEKFLGEEPEGVLKASSS